MKYYRMFLLSFALSLSLTLAATAQQPAKLKRPIKNPPQYPNIIDLENKDTPPATAPKSPKADEAAKPPEPGADAQSKSINQLSGEIRALAREVRSLNIRQQAQLDMMKMSRVELRIDRTDRDLRPVRDRLAAIDFEEKNLTVMMTRESLLAQTANIATTDRDALMQQIRAQHEARLRAIQAERERLRVLENDLSTSLGTYQKLSGEMERRIQQAEESLKQFDKADAAKPEQKN